MWTVLYLAQSKIEADKIENALNEVGVLVRVRNIGKDKSGHGIFEIMVPQSEIDYAYPVLTSVIF
jgi:hypothetical protein